jgi:nucleoside-diphosphate-sugar epimerase
LGRHLAAALAERNLPVTVVDNLSGAASTFDCDELRSPSIDCILGDVGDRALTQSLVTSHRFVVHFASVVGVEETIRRPFDTARNLGGTLNVVEALTPEHVALFGSSADIYGLHSRIYGRPMREDDLTLFESPSVNRWVYPKIKALEENLFDNSPASTVNVRIFNTYGPEMDIARPQRLIPQFLSRIRSRKPLRVSLTGLQRRALCYYEDMIRGFLLALRHAERSPGASCTVNLGATDCRPVIEIAQLTMKLAVEVGLLDRPLPIETQAHLYSQPFDDSWDRSPDIARARTLLGFAPTTNLEDGLRQTLAAYADIARVPRYEEEARPLRVAHAS